MIRALRVKSQIWVRLASAAGASFVLCYSIFQSGCDQAATRPGGAEVSAAIEAVGANPASAFAWCDAAEALWRAGQEQRARQCMRRARELGPNVPVVWLRGLHCDLAAGRGGEVLTAAVRILSLTPAYDGILFKYLADLGTGPARVVAANCGNSRALRSYFLHLAEAGRVPDTMEAWRFLAQRRLATDADAIRVVEALVRTRQGQTAQAVWAAHKAGADADYPARNLLFNGGFEMAFTGSAMDWRIEPAESATAVRDTVVRLGGTASLRVEFLGKENVDYRNVWQLAYVPAGSYVLKCSVRTQGLTSDQGVFLRAVDTGDPEGPGVSTSAVSGGTDGWRRVSAVFRTEKGRTLRVEVCRTKSRKLDNKIRGVVWIDAVRLVTAS
ncbi:MAG: hypothetical protein HYZ57_16045 [Acidobacteria bacterium]|nr:hypothetical protein [Acidobacteriota bacterium]